MPCAKLCLHLYMCHRDTIFTYIIFIIYWVKANVMPVFKKGDKSLASNYLSSYTQAIMYDHFLR